MSNDYGIPERQSYFNKRRVSFILGCIAWALFVFTNLLEEIKSAGYKALSESLGLDVSEMNFWVFALPMILWHFICGVIFPIPQIKFDNSKM